MDKAPTKFGLIIPKIEKEHWVLGGAVTEVTGAIINPLGDWTKYLTGKETQDNDYFDTQNCTGYGTTNAVESHINFLEKVTTTDYSERYLGIEAGTDPKRGNDPHTVAEAWRTTCGAIPDADLPLDDTVKTAQAYYRPKPVPKAMLEKGKKWYEKYQLNHEWIFEDRATPQQKEDALKAALKRGTVCVSAYAWVEGPNGYTKPKGASDNHWVQLVRYNERNQPVVFDSYETYKGLVPVYIKELESLYDFAMAKVFYVTRTKKPKHVSRIIDWAHAIERAEGGKPTDRNIKNNNSGNLKYSEYTATLGPIGKDKDNFCIFDSYAHGFSALCAFLTDAASNRLKPYHDCTLDQFTTIFAMPPRGSKYAKNVAKALGVPVNTPIKNLL